MHDVQDLHLREHDREHCRNDRKIFCNVIGDTKCCQGTSCDQKLFSDLYDFQYFCRIRIQIHHICRFFCRLCAGIHRQSDIRLCKCRRIVRSVSGHGDQFALRLFFLDRFDLVFRFTLCDKSIHAGFFCDRCCSQRIVSGTHDRLDPNLPQTGEPLYKSRFYRIFQIDHTVNFLPRAYDKRCSA